MNIQVSKATQEDVEFIADIILTAEDTGFEVTSYTQMFNLTKSELLPIFSKLLNNDSNGHALCWKTFYIAHVDGQRVGGLSAYKEGEFGDSNHLMTGALMSGFERTSIMEAFKFLAIHKDIQIPKSKNTIQIDCVSTIPSFEGKGVFKTLLNFVEEEVRLNEIEFAEIQVWKKNQHAINVYESKGYSIFDTRDSSSVSGNGKVLMRKKL